MDFHSLRRRDLQALCKKNRVPANMTNVAMADALQALQTVEGLDELRESLNSQSPVESKATMSVPLQACRTSARRKPVRTKPVDDGHLARSLPRARRVTTGNQEGEEGITMNMPFIKTPRQARSGTRDKEVIQEGPQEQIPDTPITTGEWKRPVNPVVEKAPCVGICYTRRRSSRKQEMKSTQEEEHKGVDAVVSPTEILGDPSHQTLESRGVVGRSIGFLIPCGGEYSTGLVEERVQSDPMITGPVLCLGDAIDLTERLGRDANPVRESKRIKIDPNPDNGSADLSKSRTTAQGDELKSQHCNLGVDDLKVEDEELELQSQDLNVGTKNELPDLRVELREKDHELNLQNTVGGGCEATYMDTDRPDQSTEVLIKGSDETSIEQPSQFMEENMVVVGTLDQSREDRIPELTLEIVDSKRASSTNVQGVNAVVSPKEVSGGPSHQIIEVRGVVDRSVIPCSGKYRLAPVEERSQSAPMTTGPDFCHGDTVDLTEGHDQNAEPVKESKGIKIDPNPDNTSADFSKSRTAASDEVNSQHCNPGAENLNVVHEEFDLSQNLVVKNWNGSFVTRVGLREEDRELGVQNTVGGGCEATDTDTDRLDQSTEILIKVSDETSIEQASEFWEENMIVGGTLDQSSEDIIPTDMDADRLDQSTEILIKGSDETSVEQASGFLEENIIVGGTLDQSSEYIIPTNMDADEPDQSSEILIKGSDEISIEQASQFLEENMVVVGTLDQSRENIIPTDMDTDRLDQSAETLIKGSNEMKQASQFFKGNMVVVGTFNHSREDIIPTEQPKVLDSEGTSSNVQGKLQVELPIEIQTSGDQHSKVLEHLVFQETGHSSGPSDSQANKDNVEQYYETLATNNQISSTSETRKYSPCTDFINISSVDSSTKDAAAAAIQANIESKTGDLIGFHDLYNEQPLLEQIEVPGDVLLVNQYPAESKNKGIREEVGEVDQSKPEKQNMEKTGLHSFSLRKLRSMYKESRDTKCLVKLEPGCGRPKVQAELEEDRAENSGLMNSLSLRKLKQIYKEKVARDDQSK